MKHYEVWEYRSTIKYDHLYENLKTYEKCSDYLYETYQDWKKLYPSLGDDYSVGLTIDDDGWYKEVYHGHIPSKQYTLLYIKLVE